MSGKLELGGAGPPDKNGAPGFPRATAIIINTNPSHHHRSRSRHFAF